MKANRLLRLLPILMAVLLTAGCARSEKTDGQTDKTSSEESAAQLEPVPVPVPEGGWTFEDVAKTVYINGKQISYPFTVDSLGKGYSIKKETNWIEDDGYATSTLYYNDTPVCILGYDCAEDPRHLEREPVDAMLIDEKDEWDNECAYEMIKTNGVGLTDDVSAAKEVYGEPDHESESGSICLYLCPNTEKSSISFWSENGKIYKIYLRFSEKTRT